ncbi:MAG TPA: histidine phosphatase family protein [Acidobacteriota bacterium]|nr:histidine phosphatase family protein [Acidobacteriota bacterium]
MSHAPNRTVRLFLVRHGETADNIQMRYLGVSDVSLTANGKRQALRAGAALSKLPIRVILSSPMRRAADTAAIIHAACGAELRLDARLAEGSFGNWEGRTRAEVLRLGRQDAELLARWESDPACAPPGGESIQSIQERMADLVEELTDEFPDASVAIVSHVGPIKALLASVLDIPLQSTRRFFLDPGTITVVEWGAQPVLRLFNSHAHLGWASARWMKQG